MNKYVKAPNSISFKDCQNNNFKLSASLYKKLTMKNKHFKPVSDFLSRELTRRDLGTEIGSLSYIDKSTHYFLRTKALQEHSFIPEITSESALPMRPVDFEDMDLKKGDILISKDSNIGEIVVLEKDYPNYMLSSAIYRLPVVDKWKFYLLAMLKHDVFREQLRSIVPKGATICHAKTLFLDCLIPLPNKNKEDVVSFVSILVKAIVEKETLIQKRHNDIFDKIEKELNKNQKNNEFRYALPRISDVEKMGRLDTSLYEETFQRLNFLVKNYCNGSENLINRGFSYARGTSLEQNNIKTRIDSDTYIKGFYELVVPTNISQYGYVKKSSYIGTPIKLKKVKQGDIIFGGEGFGKGRTFVVIDETDNVVTNYHGIRIINTHDNLTESIFVRCFLAFWRSKGMIDYIGVGGSGGHCSPTYFNLIEIPNFPVNKQKTIANLYHNSKCKYESEKFTLDNFIQMDSEYNKVAGIYELDKSLKILKSILNKAIDKIVNDEDVDIAFC